MQPNVITSEKLVANSIHSLCSYSSDAHFKPGAVTVPRDVVVGRGDWDTGCMQQ